MGNGENANGDQMSSFRAMFSTLFHQNNLIFFNIYCLIFVRIWRMWFYRGCYLLHRVDILRDYFDELIIADLDVAEQGGLG